MIHIAVCDDEKKMAETLAEKVQMFVKEQNAAADISIYTQSGMLEYDIEEGKYFDLVLSDIEMPYIDGMKLAADIRERLPEAIIIFITSYIKYAVDAYELSIFRYIPKNSVDQKLGHAVRDAMKMIMGREEKEYYISTPTRAEKIMYRDILYIQREGKNSVFVLANGGEAKVRKSLSNVEKELDSEDFDYIDRGTIVNIQHIMKIKGRDIEMKNGDILFASQAKLEMVRKKINAFWEKRI